MDINYKFLAHSTCCNHGNELFSNQATIAAVYRF
jgi:hypothetical protein